MTGITDRFRHLQARITAAATAAGRRPGDVTLVAVSKGQGPDAIRQAYAAGLRHFGENYLQEALPKIRTGCADLVWHFIGHVQSNKARDVAAAFTWVQAVDSPRIAERLASQRPFYGPELQVCIQLQPVDSPDRAGCPAGRLTALAEAIAGLPKLRLRGLMVLPKAGLDEAAIRRQYREARSLFDDLVRLGHAVDTFSAGMSTDLELAIEEGSTMIRVGTALFGPRRPITHG